MQKTINESTFTRVHHGSQICWRSVVGGILVAFLAYMILAALGGGIAGLTVSHIIERGESTSGVLTGAGVWIGCSAVIALFLGCYFATRFSDVTHKQIGAAQGIVIAAVFFYILVNVTGSAFSSFVEIHAHFSGDAAGNAEMASKSLGEASWFLFATMTLGTIAGLLGGMEGARGNIRKPFSRFYSDSYEANPNDRKDFQKKPVV